MDNYATTVIIILLGAGVLLAITIFLVVYLLRIRARRRYSTEQNILWHFPSLEFRDRPPVLPRFLRRDSTRKSDPFSRFSWFISDDKISLDKLRDPIDFPEPAMIMEATRQDPSSMHLP
ncbi:hypothetical protein K438DRAFT_1776970 [Mycena galopus ATCC 62051]|nr:hypothetical protein K438DRAFT_1776970 [Mycena galopus ATCC 62051]